MTSTERSRPNPVDKALWTIESHYADPITLDDLARVACVSRFHLSRVFGYATGLPIMRYLRDRRLSQAARALADGRQDILDLALSLGYGSHEAFSRAFKERFGQSPQYIRSQGHTDNLDLLEAHRMSTTTFVELAEPEIRTGTPMLLAGLSKPYTLGANAAIPGQWQAFGPRIDSIPAKVGNATWGAVYNLDDEQNHDYLCAVEVAGFDTVPEDFARLRIPALTWAVFRHDRHVSEIQAVCKAIWSVWLPACGREPVDAPFLERYGADFNPRTGQGGFEVWLAVKAPER